MNYNAQMEELQATKRKVEKEIKDVQSTKQDLLIWQQEVEETLKQRINSFIIGKEELTTQIQELVTSTSPLFSLKKEFNF
jgi:t-SNARE complex subunit (syntaxin)